MRTYRVVPYDILGVKLYSVESEGYVLKYCDDKEDALSQCDELNKEYLYD
jgi:hypothetical protein